LATFYSNDINQLLQSSCGFTKITKRNFWPIFRTAWKKALTVENIRSAFETTGIYPVQPQKVLESLKKTPSPASSDNETKRKTPGSIRGIHRTLKAIQRDKLDITAGLELIARASEKLAIKAELMDHENKGLREALIDEKKRRKKSKAMGLLAKDEPGQGMFFSPAKIASVRAHIAAEEASKEQEKVARQIQLQEKAKEKELKALRVQERREERLRTRAAKEAEKKRAQIARKEAEAAKTRHQNKEQKQKIQAKVSRSPQKRKAVDEVAESSKRACQRVMRNGRAVTLPTRFRE
jgi:hypothetical protein